MRPDHFGATHKASASSASFLHHRAWYALGLDTTPCQQITHACSGRSLPAVSGAHAIDTAAVSESCLWPHADDLALPGATAQYLFVCVVVAGADLCIITLRIL